MPGHFDVFLGNTDVVLAEPNLNTNQTYYFRLKATDLAGNVGPWSPTTSYRAP